MIDKKLNIVMRLTKAEDEVTRGFSRCPEYHLFFQMISTKHNFRFAYEKDAYLAKGEFKNVCKYHLGKIVPAEKKFKADKIYQFKRMADDKQDFSPAKILNTPAFRTFGSKKSNQYEFLSEFFPKTQLVLSLKDLQKTIATSRGTRVIVKPNSGQKGDGVLIRATKKRITAKDIDMNKLETRGYLVQEFADTSCGIKNVVDSTHDLKILNIGNNMFFNLRTPYRDGVICTFDSDYTEVPIKKIPKAIIDFRNTVHKKIMKKYPKQIYSMDIGMTKNGPILFELNSHTAFPYIHFDYALDFIKKFITHIEKY